MKKYLFNFAVMMMGTALLTGCLSSNDDKNDINNVEVIVTQGALVLNNGSSYSGINGSLTYIDYMTETAKEVNVSLGGTPNDICVYGDKIYITGSDENTIFVLNRKDFSLITRLSTVTSMGDAEGVMPRHLAAYADKVYFSTYGGYVGVIDTLSMSITGKIQVGSYPEGMSVGLRDDVPFLYVANSDYGNGNGSISVINLSTRAVTELKNEKIRNPQEIAVAGETVYVLDWGYYDENFNQKEAGIYVISGSSVTKLIPDATGMAAAGYYIYTFNSPFGSASINYSIYNLTYNYVSSFSFSGDSSAPLISPAAISVDPNTGYLLVATRPLDPDTGYPSYTTPGYVNLYKSNGEFYKSFPVGVEPHAITYTYKAVKASEL